METTHLISTEARGYEDGFQHSMMAHKHRHLESLKAHFFAYSLRRRTVIETYGYGYDNGYLDALDELRWEQEHVR